MANPVSTTVFMWLCESASYNCDWFDPSTESHALIQEQLALAPEDPNSSYWMDYCAWLTWSLIICALHDGDSFASTIRSADTSIHGLHVDWGQGIRHTLSLRVWNRASRQGVQYMASRLLNHADIWTNRADLFMKLHGCLSMHQQQMIDTNDRIQQAIQQVTDMAIDDMDVHVQCLVISALPTQDLMRFYTGFADCLSHDMVVISDGTPIHLIDYFSQVSPSESALIDRVKLHTNALVCSTMPTDQKDALLDYTRQTLSQLVAVASTRKALVASLESVLASGIVPRQRLLKVALESFTWPSHG